MNNIDPAHFGTTGDGGVLLVNGLLNMTDCGIFQCHPVGAAGR